MISKSFRKQALIPMGALLIAAGVYLLYGRFTGRETAGASPP